MKTTLIYKNNGAAIRHDIHCSGIRLECSSAYYGSVYLGFSTDTMSVFGIGYEFSDRNGCEVAEDWIQRTASNGSEVIQCGTLHEFIERIQRLKDEEGSDSLQVHLPEGKGT